MKPSQPYGGLHVSAVIDEPAEGIAQSGIAQQIDAFEKLTPRLKEVLLLIAIGLSTKDIAAHLGIGKKTVEFHRDRLRKRIGIRTIAQPARYAVRVGAIPS